MLASHLGFLVALLLLVFQIFGQSQLASSPSANRTSRLLGSGLLGSWSECEAKLIDERHSCKHHFNSIYPDITDQGTNYCHYIFGVLACVLEPACLKCTDEQFADWTINEQQKLDHILHDYCQEWEDEAPQLVCATLPTTPFPTEPSTSPEPTTTAPFPLWIIAAIVLFVFLLALIIFHFCFFRPMNRNNNNNNISTSQSKPKSKAAKICELMAKAEEKNRTNKRNNNNHKSTSAGGPASAPGTLSTMFPSFTKVKSTAYKKSKPGGTKCKTTKGNQ